MAGFHLDINDTIERNVLSLAANNRVMEAYDRDRDGTLLAMRSILSQTSQIPEPLALEANPEALTSSGAIDIIDNATTRANVTETKSDDRSVTDRLLDLSKTPPEHQRLVSYFERFFGLYQRTSRAKFTRKVFVPIFDYVISNFASEWVKVDIAYEADASNEASLKLTLRDVGFARSKSVSVKIKQTHKTRTGSFQMVVPVDLEFYEYEGPMAGDFRYSAEVKSTGDVYFSGPDEEGYAPVQPLVRPVSQFRFMELGGGDESNVRTDTIQDSEGFSATAAHALNDTVSIGLDYKTSMTQTVTTTYKKVKSGQLYAAAWPSPKNRWEAPVKGLMWLTDEAPKG